MRNIFILLALLAIVAGCGKSSSDVTREEEPADRVVESAEQGDAEAQYELGRRYYKGDGIKRDFGKAIEWFTKAAEQGHAEAQYMLGKCYDCGWGVKQDFEKAIEWYTKAAEQGWADAQYLLGEYYNYGEGVEQDLEKAAEWYAKAAEHDRFARDALKFLEEYRNSGNSGSQTASGTKVSKPTGRINEHEYVDLGLSVKWAACNVGASSPEEYGDRFAWGETSTKNEYTEENSKTPPVSVGCIAGNPLYDAARANWGGTWRLPMGREIGELFVLCTFEYDVWKGVEGYKVTGPNGNSIFLPSYKEDNGVGGYCCYGDYWSANHQLSDYSEHLAYTFFFARANSRPVFDTNWTSPYYGSAVRPVSE